ncbi:MAG: hypothetical protein ACI8W7_004214, partial [Gammaproteobacteria bacterium]
VVCGDWVSIQHRSRSLEQTIRKSIDPGAPRVTSE